MLSSEHYLPQPMPWLVYTCHGEHGKTETFYSLSEERFYVRNARETEQTSFHGCSQGWLLMMDKQRESCFLLDPLSLEKIMLPPPPEPHGATVFLTCSPTKPGCLVILFNPFYTFFMYTGPKKREWRMRAFHLEDEDQLTTLGICNGDVYLYTKHERLAIVEKIGHRRLVMRWLQVMPPHCLPVGRRSVKLIECSGELFLVFLLYYQFSYTVYTWEVYRMDFTEMKWMRVSSLGDRALCYSETVTGMLSASTGSKVIPNSIYFIDWVDQKLCRFDLTDKSIYKNLAACPSKMKAGE